MEDFGAGITKKIVKKYNKDGEICNDDELVYAQTTETVYQRNRKEKMMMSFVFFQFVTNFTYLSVS